VTDQFGRRVAGLREQSRRVGEHASPTLAPLRNGDNCVVAQGAGGGLALLHLDALGEEVLAMHTLDGFTAPAAVTNPHTGEALVLAVDEQAGEAVLFGATPRDGFRELARLGPADPQCGAVVVLDDGAILAFVVRDGVIAVQQSRDAGETFEPLGG
jgi:hypothetical protein